MNITLVFPPFVDPRAPYLALPSLTAFLRRKGYQVAQRDFNAELLNRMLTSSYLSNVFQTKCAPVYEFVLSHIDSAVSSLRSADQFFDFQRYSWSRGIVDLSLRCLSSCYEATDINLRSPESGALSLAECLQRVLYGPPTPWDRLYAEWCVPDILAHKPDLVGISISNGSQLLAGLKLSFLLKSSGIYTTIGGPTITRLRHETLSYSEFFDVTDGAIIYEGEYALARLCMNLELGRDPFDDIQNCIYSNGSRTVLRNVPFALDLNALPTPDFRGLYFGSYLAPHIVLPLLTSKGCSWGRCTFCTIPNTSSSLGLRNRTRDVELVVEDVASLELSLGARHFFFVDENINSERLAELGAALVKGQRDVRWIAFSRFDKGHTGPRCTDLYSAGCRKLLMNLESGSPRVLGLMKKGTTPELVNDNLIALHEGQIRVHLFGILGFPLESTSEMESTLTYILERREILFERGFSCSFSEFILEEESAIFQNANRGKLAQKQDSEGQITSCLNGQGATFADQDLRKIRRLFNAEIRDAYFPNEMIGWEEYDLLYLDNGAVCRFPWRLDRSEIRANLYGSQFLNLVFYKRPLLILDGVLGSFSGLALINLASAYILPVTHDVLELLWHIDGQFPFSAIIASFAESKGVSESAIERRCTVIRECLWKHGFIASKEQTTPSKHTDPLQRQIAATA